MPSRVLLADSRAGPHRRGNPFFLSLSSPAVLLRNARISGLLGGGFLGIFTAHSLATTAELLATVPPWLLTLNRFLLPLLNVCFILGFTWVGFVSTEYLLRFRRLEKPRDGFRRPVYLLQAARQLGPLYALCLLIGFGLEPLLAAAQHLPYQEPARLSWYLLGLSNFDKLRIQPTSWVLAELWAVAAVGQWLASGLLILWLSPRRWWVPLLGLMLAGSLSFQLLHASETLLLKLHSGAIFTDFSIGSLFAVGAAAASNASTENAQNRWRALRFAAMAGLLVLALFQRQWLAVPLLAPAYRLVVSSVCGGLILASFCDNSPAMRCSWAAYGFTWLGRRTYAAYCLHTAAISLTAAFLTHLAEPAAWLLTPISLLLTVGFARVWGGKDAREM